MVEDKWIATIEHSVKNEMQRISQRLTLRIKELAERYELALPSVLNEVKSLEEKVNAHLGNWEQLKKIKLLPNLFSIEGNELTPTLKLKRKVILEKYSKEFNEHGV